MGVAEAPWMNTRFSLRTSAATSSAETARDRQLGSSFIVRSCSGATYARDERPLLEDSVLLQAAVERAPGDAERLRGLGTIPPGGLESGEDTLPLGSLELVVALRGQLATLELRLIVERLLVACCIGRGAGREARRARMVAEREIGRVDHVYLHHDP